VKQISLLLCEMLEVVNRIKNVIPTILHFYAPLIKPWDLVLYGCASIHRHLNSI